MVSGKGYSVNTLLAQQYTHARARSPTYIHTQACAHIHVCANASTPIHAYARNPSLTRARTWYTYIHRYIRSCMHNCINVYGLPWEVYNKELYQTDLLCIISLCLYHNFLLPFTINKLGNFTLKGNSTYKSVMPSDWYSFYKTPEVKLWYSGSNDHVVHFELH